MRRERPPAKETAIYVEIQGEDAVYPGLGDLHDSKFDYLEVASGWSALLASNHDMEELHRAECLYGCVLTHRKKWKIRLSLQDHVYLLVSLLTYVSRCFCRNSFGDAVHTVHRMEITGCPGRIQISSTVAILLKRVNKGSWLTLPAGGVRSQRKRAHGNLLRAYQTLRVDDKRFDIALVRGWSVSCPRRRNEVPRVCRRGIYVLSVSSFKYHFF
jgi:hypothetical protein